MTILFRSVRIITINNIDIILYVETDGEKLYCQADRHPNEFTIQSISYSVEYEGVTKSVHGEAGPSTRVSFTYGDSKEIIIKNTSISIDEAAAVSSYTFSWRRDRTQLSVPEPTATHSVSGLQVGTSTSVTIVPSDPLSRYTKVMGFIIEYSRDADGIFNRSTCAITPISSGFRCTHSVNSSRYKNGSWIRYIISVASYENEEQANVDSGEQFIGHATIVSPIYILSTTGNDVPFCITYTPNDSGEPFTVSWQSHSGSGNFNVERSLDDGAWTAVYSGTSHSFSDTVPSNWKTLMYRVQCVDSPWWTGELLKSVVSNLYIGTASGIKQAAALYIGQNGGLLEVVPFMSVGGM